MAVKPFRLENYKTIVETLTLAGEKPTYANVIAAAKAQGFSPSPATINAHRKAMDGDKAPKPPLDPKRASLAKYFSDAVTGLLSIAQDEVVLQAQGKLAEAMARNAKLEAELAKAKKESKKGNEGEAAQVWREPAKAMEDASNQTAENRRLLDALHKAEKEAARAHEGQAIAIEANEKLMAEKRSLASALKAAEGALEKARAEWAATQGADADRELASQLAEAKKELDRAQENNANLRAEIQRLKSELDARAQNDDPFGEGAYGPAKGGNDDDELPF